MPIESPESRRIAAPLAHRVGREASAAQIAAVMTTLFDEIHLALTPIVGPRGVAALHSRSIHLTAQRHVWMAVLLVAKPPPPFAEAFAALLAQREPDEALAGGEAFLQTFHQLLLSLIGPSLTERLLRALWIPTTSGEPAQDMSS